MPNYNESLIEYIVMTIYQQRVDTQEEECCDRSKRVCVLGEGGGGL